MSDADPFVLLPVRIETRFTRIARGVELRVRIYPDDIAIGAPPDALTAEEHAAGESYWRARAVAATPGAGPAERKIYEGAWTAIAVRHGEYRAGWIVRETRPSNWDPSRGQPESRCRCAGVPAAWRAASPRRSRAPKHCPTALRSY